MELDDCYKKGLIKRAKINRELAKSLVEMSEIKEITVRKANVDDFNISAYISMAYDSLREILEAICVLNGYKVLSHICLGELLKKIIDDFDFNEFDRLRFIRNGINYYGTRIDFMQGKEILGKIFMMKKRLKDRYLKDI